MKMAYVLVCCLQLTNVQPEGQGPSVPGKLRWTVYGVTAHHGQVHLDSRDERCVPVEPIGEGSVTASGGPWPQEAATLADGMLAATLADQHHKTWC